MTGVRKLVGCWPEIGLRRRAADASAGHWQRRRQPTISASGRPKWAPALHEFPNSAPEAFTVLTHAVSMTEIARGSAAVEDNDGAGADAHAPTGRGGGRPWRDQG